MRIEVEENAQDRNWEWDAGLGWDHKNGDKNDRKELDVGVTASHKNEKGDTE